MGDGPRHGQRSNLQMLHEAKACYLVGTPKSMLKQFEQDLLEQDWEQVQSDIRVKRQITGICQKERSTVTKGPD